MIKSQKEIGMKKVTTILLALVASVCLCFTATSCMGGDAESTTSQTLVYNETVLNSEIKDGADILIKKDIELTTLIIPGHVTATIDLGGKTISAGLEEEGRHHYAIVNYGTLTLKGDGVISARGIENFGNLTVDGVTINSIDANGGAAIWNEGNLTVNGGTFHAEYEGSSSDTSGPGCLNNSGTAVINGGTFTSNNMRTYAIISTGSIIINDATVESAHGALAVTDGDATINGGSFHASVHYGLYAWGIEVAVNGGTFTGDQYGVDVYADQGSIVTVADGVVLTHNGTNGIGTVVFAKDVPATSAVDAQSALDNATSGAVVRLAKDVDYGVLYLRQSSLSTSIDVSDWAGNGDHERFRSIENLTIVGAEGATVDSIVIEAGTYTPEHSHSNSATVQYLNSYIAIKNLKIVGVTFSGEATALSITGKVSVNGLTLDSCSMTDDGDNNLLIATGKFDGKEYTDRNTQSVFLKQSLKNIRISYCTVIGANKVAELRECENVTILNNVFKNIVARDLLLVTNTGCSYTGKIEIIGNLSDGSTERFLRASNVNAKVSLLNNQVINWSSSEGDTDIVKFSGNGANVSFTVDGNDWNGETDANAIISGTVNLG